MTAKLTWLEESRTAGTLPYEIDCARRMSFYGRAWVIALADGTYRAEYETDPTLDPTSGHCVCIYANGAEIYHH